MEKLEKLIYTGVWFIIEIIVTMSLMFIVCEDDSIDLVEGILFGFTFLNSVILGFTFCHTYHKND